MPGQRLYKDDDKGTAMLTMYGIANCDTVRKARKWLDGKGIDYTFHDYKKHGVDAARLHAWCEALGWEAVLNRRGTTWRKLDEADKQDVDQDKAERLMLDNPSMIKRPLLDHDGELILGFDENRYQSLL